MWLVQKRKWLFWWTDVSGPWAICDHAHSEMRELRLEGKRRDVYRVVFAAGLMDAKKYLMR